MSWAKSTNSNQIIYHKSKKFRKARVMISKNSNNNYVINAVCLENTPGGGIIEKYSKNRIMDNKKAASKLADAYKKQIDNKFFRK